MRVLPAVTPMLAGTIEPIVTLGDADPPTRSLTLGLGFDRAYLVEDAPMCGHDHGGPAARTHALPGVLAALASLEPTLRAALGLDARRMAALAALDGARAALARGDRDAARDIVARCRDEVEAAFAATPTGDWKLRRYVLTAPTELAWFAERVLAEFARSPADALGRVRQLAIALGLDAPRDRERRGAFVEGLAHVVDLPVAVTHPVRGDLVRSVPLIPQDERPDLVLPPADRYAAPTVVVDPLTAGYDELQHACQRVAHLRTLDAPPEVLDREAQVVQQIVDRLAGAAVSPPAVVDAWEPTAVRHERVELTHRGDADGIEPPAAVLWLDADTLAVTRGDRLATIALPTGETIGEHVLGHATVQGCDDAGRSILVAGEPVEYGGSGLGCFEVASGEWLAELPAHVPAVSFGYDDLGASTLYEHRRAARAHATALCFARGLRSVLVSRRNDAIDGGGIWATATLRSEVASGVLVDATRRAAAILLADGTFVDPSAERARQIDDAIGERRCGSSHLPWPAAIARGEPWRWRFVLPSLHVGDVERTYFRLGFPIDAASFSPDGDHLVVVADEILVIALPDGTITTRLPR